MERLVTEAGAPQSTAAAIFLLLEGAMVTTGISGDTRLTAQAQAQAQAQVATLLTPIAHCCFAE